MDQLTLGDLVIIEISLIALMKGVDENSELGKQICEAIAKVDARITAIRAEFESKEASKH